MWRVEPKLLNFIAAALYRYTQKQGAQMAKKHAKATWLGRWDVDFHPALGSQRSRYN